MKSFNNVLILTDNACFMSKTQDNADCLKFPLTLLVDGHPHPIHKKDVSMYFFNDKTTHKLTCHERGDTSWPFTVDSTNAKIKNALNDTIAQII